MLAGRDRPSHWNTALEPVGSRPPVLNLQTRIMPWSWLQYLSQVELKQSTCIGGIFCKT